MMNSTTEGQQGWTKEAWNVRPFGVNTVPQQYVVWFHGEFYSPDDTWIVVGTGAATRLAAKLNAEHNALRDAREALERIKDALEQPHDSLLRSGKSLAYRMVCGTLRPPASGGQA